MEANSTSVSFIVPTLRRPDFLRQCIASILSQTVHPSEILVGARADDKESREAAQSFTGDEPIRIIEAKGVGVVGSMSSCLLESKGEYVVLVDDDVQLPPSWLEKMLKHLDEHPDVVGTAGRDALQDHPERRRHERRVMDVGTFHWYGRITGNHHRGGGEPRRVDILRGSNCLFRGAFIRETGFEQRLRGKGAQVNWELAIAFQAMARKARLFYDPSVEVMHHVAPRFDSDVLHRGGYDATAISDNAFNETLVVLAHCRGWRRISALAWQAAVGSPLVPGVAHWIKRALQRDPHLTDRLLSTIKGRMDAIRYCSKSSAAERSVGSAHGEGSPSVSPK